MTNNQKLVGRHKRLAFMKVGAEGTYDRITGFTSLIEGKEAKNTRASISMRQRRGLT